MIVQFGLVVDAIHDTEEIVVKPLQKQIKGVSVFAGATIMGDGKVALILDVVGIAQRAHVVSGVRDRALSEKTSTQYAEAAEDRQTVLLVSASGGGRMAIPLAQVARLEEFPRSALERVGNQDVVQYRGEILPLIRVSRALSERKKEEGTKEEKTSFHLSWRKATPSRLSSTRERGRRVGLIVGSILDIVEETLVARSRANRPGVLFTAVIQGRVTEVLDIEGIIRQADPDFFAQTWSSKSDW